MKEFTHPTWVNEFNYEHYVKRMAKHYKDTKTEDEIRQLVKDDPQALDDFVDYLANDYEGEHVKD